MPAPAPVPRLSKAERADFWRRVATHEGIRECWEWISTRQNVDGGYGRFVTGEKQLLAHRVAYALAYGVNPGRRLVLHCCDNHICVNPRHLRLGTEVDNARDEAVNGFMEHVHQMATGRPGARRPLSLQQVRAMKVRAEKLHRTGGRVGRPPVVTAEVALALRFAYWNLSADIAALAAAHAVPKSVAYCIVTRRSHRALEAVDGEPTAAEVEALPPRACEPSGPTAKVPSAPPWRIRLRELREARIAARKSKVNGGHLPTVAIPALRSSPNEGGSCSESFGTVAP